MPRSDYPAGRAGYLRWRRAQRDRHARDLVAILDGTGVDGSVSARAAQIVAKEGLGSDPEVQAFEDAVSLTFLETELHSVLGRLDDDSKATDIVVKTLAKMSPAGREQAVAVAATLDKRSRQIVTKATVAFAQASATHEQEPGGLQGRAVERG